jgi:NosR/NirI family transcriptional regulator, nitrous oxide reductase regulator
VDSLKPASLPIISKQTLRDSTAKSSPRRIWIVHLTRVTVLLVIAFLLHAIHVRQQRSITNANGQAISVDRYQAFFPSGVGVDSQTQQSEVTVLDGKGDVLGSVVQTSPDSDPFLGFSGPTNLLLAFDPQKKVIGTAILSSRDTRDHVAQIERDPGFLKQWNGRTAEELANSLDVDHVSGATLTSMAIAQGVQKRFGGQVSEGKFQLEPSADIVRQYLPTAARLEQNSGVQGCWSIIDNENKKLGQLLATSPTADEIVGYQGPTLVWFVVHDDDEVIGLKVDESFDNEPYVGYVRKDRGFASLLVGKELSTIAQWDLASSGIEGVSGATMTSQAVVKSLIRVAKNLSQAKNSTLAASAMWRKRLWRGLGTGLLILAMIVVVIGRWSTPHLVRSALRWLVILYLGLFTGELLSMAMFSGWIQYGLPWPTAFGLILLAGVAFYFPIAAKTNLYCSHLCPHGAVQQILPRRWKWRSESLSRFNFLLRVLRPILLIYILLVMLTPLPFSLVDIEPFDAYLWQATAWPSIVIAVGSLIFSLFVPMGYCRFGCPTGGLLQYLRRNAKSHRFNAGDLLAVGCLVVCLAALLLKS